MLIRRYLLAIVLSVFMAAIALSYEPASHAQSGPGWAQGFVPTPAQWNAEWSSKMDFNSSGCPIASGCTGANTAALALANLGAMPVAGGTFTGTVTYPAGTTGGSPLVLPPGAAPTSPSNGALWTTSAAAFIRLNGVTQQLGQSIQSDVTSSGITLAFGGQYIVATSLSAYTLNLPALSGGTAGQCVQVTDGDNNASVNNITLAANGADVINYGATSGSSVAINVNSGADELCKRGTTWRAIKLA